MYDEETEEVTLLAELEGATNGKAYKDGVESGTVKVADGIIEVLYTGIALNDKHVYGVSAVKDGVESDIAEMEYIAVAEIE